MEKINWFVFLTTFYIIVSLFFGAFVSESYKTVEATKGETLGLGQTVILTITNIPAWMAVLFTGMTVLYIYIIATSFTLGGG